LNLFRPNSSATTRPRDASRRRGSATIDYLLVAGVVTSLGGIAVLQGARIIRLAWQMTHVLLSWPFP
jgi:hypothetical protein